MTGTFKDSSPCVEPSADGALAGADSSFSEARADSQLVAAPASRCLRGSPMPSMCEAASAATSHGLLRDSATPLARFPLSPQQFADRYCGTNAVVAFGGPAQFAIPAG